MRVFHYSYDYPRVEHLQWPLKFAEQVVFEFPEATQLLVTGTPQSHNTKLPHSLDMIKLPDMGAIFQGGYGDLKSLRPSRGLNPRREVIILNTVRHFDPDVVFIDDGLMGQGGKVALTVDYLRLERPETKLVTVIDITECSAMILRHILNSSKEMALMPA